eukprot:1207509-Amphidinium_carterae.1
MCQCLDLGRGLREDSKLCCHNRKNRRDFKSPKQMIRRGSSSHHSFGIQWVDVVMRRTLSCELCRSWAFALCSPPKLRTQPLKKLKN